MFRCSHTIISERIMRIIKISIIKINIIKINIKIAPTTCRSYFNVNFNPYPANVENMVSS